MIKSSAILFVLFYLVSAHSQQTIDKLNSNQLKLPKESISKALSIDANGQVKSSGTSDVELGYLSGASSNVQGQINDKANDSDAVHLTGDESISGVKTLTGKLVTSSTVNASIPCPVMTQTQRDAIATPVTGDCVFNSNTSLSNIYDGSIWKAMGGSGGGIGLWVTSNGYAVDDVVIESNNIYICLTAHTSGTFATDLASLYWLRLSTDVTGATGLLPLATGGTNKSITASNGSIIYSDSDSLELLGPGTSGQILQSNGSAAPSWGDKTDYSVTNSLETSIGTNQVLLETGNKNILTNPSFEHSTFDSGGWVNSAGSFTENFTFKLDGAKSARLVLSSQTMSLTQSSVLYQSNFVDGVQGIATVRIKSNVALKVCSIQAGTVSTNNCVNVSTDNKWGLYKVPFILGATSNGISISSNGTLVSGTVYIDDAFVGAVDLKQDVNNLGPWIAFTPTGQLTTNTTYTGFYRQNGTDLEVTTQLAFSGASNAGSLLVNLPSGFTIDFSKLPVSNTIIGQALGQDSGIASYDMAIMPSTTTSVLVYRKTVPTTFVQIGTTTNTAPFTVGAGDFHVLSYKVPVTQFSGATSVYTSTNADTDWASCNFSTLAWQGLGTVTNNLQCKRNGSDLLMKGYFTTGTVSASTIQFLLPTWNGVQLSTKNILSSPTVGGRLVRNTATTGAVKDYTVYFNPSQNFMWISYPEFTQTVSPLSAQTGVGTLYSSEVQAVDLRIPINGWENSNIIIGSFNGLQSCTNTLACTDVFSAFISSTGVVSQENVDWINGNCTLATSTFTCNYNTLGLSNPLNCSVSTIQANTAVIIHASSSTQLQTRTYVETSSSLTPYGHTVVCQKQGADYIGKTAMAVASDQNLRTPGVTDSVVYSGIIGAAGGAVSSEIGDLINGSCSGTTTKTCTLNSGAIDNGNCTCSVSGSFGECRIGLTSSTITVLTSNSAGVAADVAVNYICHGIKQ